MDMKKPSIDGIKKPHIKKTFLVKKPQKFLKKLSMDGIGRSVNLAKAKTVLKKKTIVKSVVQSAKIKLSWKQSFKRLPVAVTAVLMFVAFSFGVWITVQTPKSEAQSKEVVTQSPAAGIVPLPSEPPVTLGPIASVPNDVLFNLSLEQLEAYLVSISKTPEMKEAERLADRKKKLKEYLAEKKSPFVAIVDTIAELKHWKMVLAISNSESTLGKRCHSNNCSGIGVEPGHPLWREYPSTREWAKDLDKLLERRYKDWTLEKMNGVYNQPGSSNWLLASKQILEELQERDIE